MSKCIRLDKYGRNWHDYFYYDETSPSCLRWKVERRRGRGNGYAFIHVGDVVGTETPKGYWTVELDYDSAQVHRIIWEMFHGPLKEGEIVDHKDGGRSNRLGNLEAKEFGKNARNCKMPFTNKTGVCGVTFRDNVHGGRYIAQWRSLTTKRQHVASFSVLKHGKEKAFNLAVDYRQKMLLELNQQGAGYTERHGSTKGQHEEHAHQAAT